MKPSTYIVKLMTFGSGVQVLRRCQYGHIVKMKIFSISTVGEDKLNLWL